MLENINNYYPLNQIPSPIKAVAGALVMFYGGHVLDYLKRSQMTCDCSKTIRATWLLSEKLCSDRCKAFDIFHLIHSATAMVSSDPITRKNTFNSFRKSAEENRGIETIIQLASQAVLDSRTFSSALYIAYDGLPIPSPDNEEIRFAILNLFKEVFQKGKGFEEALQTASKAISSKIPEIRKTALGLLKELAQKDKGIEEVLQIASKAILDPNTFSSDPLTNSPDNEEIRFAILDLFKEIFQKEKGFEEALQTASKAIYSETYLVRSIAFDLLKMVAQRGEGFEKIIEISSDAFLDSDAYKNIESHVEKIDKEINDLAPKLNNHNYMNGLINGLSIEAQIELNEKTYKLKEAIAKREEYWEKASQTILETLPDSDEDLEIPNLNSAEFRIDIALRFLKEFVKKSKSFEEVAQVMSNIMFNGSCLVQEAALKVSDELKKHEKTPSS
jgi:predicted RNase H-like HicB family nuclease